MPQRIQCFHRIYQLFYIRGVDHRRGVAGDQDVNNDDGDAVNGLRIAEDREQLVVNHNHGERAQEDGNQDDIEINNQQDGHRNPILDNVAMR